VVKGGRRTTLNREAILRAGLELVDEGGSAQLTMRALAQKLGVTATALYYYFDGRDALFEALVDHVCRSIVAAAPDDGPWADRLRALLDALVAEGVRHRSVLALTITEYGKREPVLRIHEAILAILADGGFAMDAAVYVKGAVMRFCVGHLIFTDVAPGLDWRDLAADEFPRYRAAGAVHDGFDPAREFRLGLDALLDGIARGPLGPARSSD
jgi:AcrR family transcriptional regulator